MVREEKTKDQLVDKKSRYILKIGIGPIIGIVTLALAGMIFIGCNPGKEREVIELKDRVSDEELQKLSPKSADNVYLFGFDLRSTPKEDARQYLPFLKYLAKSTEYRFELRFTPRKSTIIDEIGTGRFQFAALGAVSYIRAHAKYGVIPIARGLNALGKAEYQSVIFVASKSPIRKIEDLRGKRFAFGSITSTQGHLIPRIILVQHGITLRDLAYYNYTGSHRNCANEVTSSRFDAGGIQDTMGKEMAEMGLIRIIYTSKYYPSSGIAANKDLPPEVLDKVKQALLDFRTKERDAADLYHWNKTEMSNGFIEARDDDYAELREWARKFGLL